MNDGQRPKSASPIDADGLANDEHKEAAFWHDALSAMTREALDFHRCEKRRQSAWESASQHVMTRLSATRESRMAIHRDYVRDILLPLQAVSSNLENLIANEHGRQDMSDTEREWALKTSMSQIHMLGMAAEKIQKALLGGPEPSYVFQKQSIRRILEDCINIFEGLAAQQNIRFTPVFLCGDLQENPIIEMSRPDLFRAFKHVYHNAVNCSYSEPASESDSPRSCRLISTRISAVEDNKILVSIDTSGVGIMTQEAPFLSDIRCQGRQTIDRHRICSVTGLSEIKIIVKRHGGRTMVENEKKGGRWSIPVNIELPHRQDKGSFLHDRKISETTLG